MLKRDLWSFTILARWLLPAQQIKEVVPYLSSSTALADPREAVPWLERSLETGDPWLAQDILVAMERYHTGQDGGPSLPRWSKTLGILAGLLAKEVRNSLPV